MAEKTGRPHSRDLGGQKWGGGRGGRLGVASTDNRIICMLTEELRLVPRPLAV